MFSKYWFYLVNFLILSNDYHLAKGALESTFVRCCAHGVNWAREKQSCLNFPAPVPGEPDEHQSICLTSAGVCCLRYYREVQCEKGKGAAKTGLKCLDSTEAGGEYYKDCCDGCKLGLISGSMGMECSFNSFTFGFPWNEAYKECCLRASPTGSSKEPSDTVQSLDVPHSGGVTSPDKPVDPFSSQVGGALNIPDSENLCLLFPGQLCGHVCVPTKGSYVCRCRVGFTLSVDKKSCIQDTIQNRCKLNNPCDHVCHDTGVSIECSCHVGYQLAVDQRTCNDIDECHLATHQCNPIEQVCYNRVGTYVCINSDGSLSSPGTPWGSQVSGVRPETPIRQNPALYEPPVTGTQGNFLKHGVCPTGYKFNLNTRACDDVNECSVAYGICGLSAICQNTIGSFTCTTQQARNCPNGFAFDMLMQSCIDVDECSIGANSCTENEFCVNTQGSYECQLRERLTDCPAGFKYDSQSDTCEDVNECEENLHSCLPDEELCRNVIGAYECDLNCGDGFIFSRHSRSCIDINECAETPNACNNFKDICINVIGSYRCQSLSENDVIPYGDGIIGGNENSPNLQKVTISTPIVEECPDGYGFELEARQCLDIDECAAGLHNCTTSTHFCINILGSFTCRSRGGGNCSPGYELNGHTGQCEDVDECSLGFANCLPGQICENTNGAFQCRVECRAGFKYDAKDPAVCVDIDECVLPGVCGEGNVCSNTEGSFMCAGLTDEPEIPSSTSTTPLATTTLPPCPKGYRRQGSSACRDINECEEGIHNCIEPNDECRNLPGKFVCLRRPCSGGFRRNEETNQCEDMNECDNFPCRPNEECINTPGRFLCRMRPPCHPGFIRDPNSYECVDRDECAEVSPCGANARCINTRGSFRCRSLDCSSGYQLNPLSDACEDINECETGEHDCKVPTQQCINSPGAYRCKAMPPCPTGFKRDPVNARCVDVDECVNGISDCVEGEICINQYGKYECRGSPSRCGKGFQYSSVTKRCQDLDECADDVCSETETCVNTVGSYNCVERGSVLCDFGYRYNYDSMQCEDINECDSPNPCRTNEICVNERGRYRCDNIPKKSRPNKEDKNNEKEKGNKKNKKNNKKEDKSCKPGYRYKRKKGCVDINECREGLNYCDKDTEACINLPGAYRCEPKPSIPPTSPSTTTTTSTTTPSPTIPAPLCPEGYKYNTLFRSCIDIDECLKQKCDRYERCSNIPGSFECVCYDGYTRDGLTGDCRDVNECQLGLHTCTATQRCDNSLGSYTCTRVAGCGTGYTLNHNTGKCEDDDECVLKKDDCRQLGPKWKCVNTKGSFRCAKKICPANQILNSWGLCVDVLCTPGFKPLGKNCVDIDECLEDAGNCKRNERCVNSVGSFGCVPKINCGRGYKMDEEGTRCSDIDECKDNLHECGGGQECINRLGGYLCQCPSGYRMDHSRSCQDIDECRSYYGSICGSNGICENTPGSYNCNCKTGFIKSTDGRTCTDIDECAEDENTCDHNCINVWGSHYCTCNSGYKLSPDNRTCNDIDECEAFRGRGRLCIGVCVNTPGSFKCSCPEGYRLQPDQKTCKDIDECDNVGTCRGVDDICINTRGSFKCQSIRCPPNYVRDVNMRNRCKKETPCKDDDANCLQLPLSYSYNFLPMASNMTLRPHGEVDLFTMRGPLWSNTKVHFELRMESTDAPTSLKAATRDYFLLKRTDFNQVVVTLVKSLEGPQDIMLSLDMQLYRNGLYGGSAVVKLLIIVSKYEF